MKKSVMYKVATLMAVFAIGGVSISYDALAKGGGGGGGGMGGGHFGGDGGHFGDGGNFTGGDFHGGRGDFNGGGFAGNFHDARRFGTPFFGGYDGDYGSYNSDCWSTQHRRRVWVCD